MTKIFPHIRAPSSVGLISLNILRQKINLLDPKFLDPLAAENQSEVNDLIKNLPEKLKNDLLKINNYLKSKNIDVFDFFDKMDADQDGKITRQEYASAILQDY